MKKHQLFVAFLFLLCKIAAQDPTTPTPEWNGDPAVCIPNTVGPNPSDPPYPVFPTKAEFYAEQVEIIHALGATAPPQMTTFQYIYDYDANSLIMIKTKNGITDAEYFYYSKLLKSTYLFRQYCNVSAISVDIDTDGTSAIRLSDGSYHIRPLNEFLLFSSNDPNRRILPKYIGQSYVRDVLVNNWEVCLVDKSVRRTIKRVWSFADKSVVSPLGPVGNAALPIQAIINASFDFENGTQILEVDEIFNIHSYRPGIVETAEQLAPPKGVFCDSGPGQVLASLEDIRIEWPERFSVRVEASTSRSNQWQRFHLRYDRGRQRGGRRLRYDYLPPGAEHYRSVIHDYAENLTYSIDMNTGSCQLNRSVAAPDVNPTRNPIEFFVKNEERFLFRRSDKIWQFNGYRPCRGDSIECTIVTASIDNFPPIIESDSGMATGETWDATNMEYSWSIRSPTARPPNPDGRKSFDYPGHLYLRFYRRGNPGSTAPINIRTEDLEYEFFEMSQELNADDFDVGICYRTNGYTYAHLVFTMSLVRGKIVEGTYLNRRLFERELHATLIDKMGIKYSRISRIEVDHESISNDLTIFFTLLGPTPDPGSQSGVKDEPTVEQAYDKLKRAVDDGSIQLLTKLSDEDGTEVEFRPKSNSLSSSQNFKSIHSTGTRVVTQSYSGGSEALAIIFGSVIGLFIGILIAGIIRTMRKDPMPPMPKMPTSLSNPLPNITFHKKAAQESKPSTEA